MKNRWLSAQLGFKFAETRYFAQSRRGMSIITPQPSPSPATVPDLCPIFSRACKVRLTFPCDGFPLRMLQINAQLSFSFERRDEPKACSIGCLPPYRKTAASFETHSPQVYASKFSTLASEFAHRSASLVAAVPSCERFDAHFRASPKATV